ncbi:hypothetical protein BU15DRAFT_66501 [Melanogaster broomeanus]|nr:hypothetical protein BU15DRAFT_66501 [Melanogaster broomeanus]
MAIRAFVGSCAKIAGDSIVDHQIVEGYLRCQVAHNSTSLTRSASDKETHYSIYVVDDIPANDDWPATDHTVPVTDIPLAGAGDPWTAAIMVEKYTTSSRTDTIFEFSTRRTRAIITPEVYATSLFVEQELECRFSRVVRDPCILSGSELSPDFPKPVIAPGSNGAVIAEFISFQTVLRLAMTCHSAAERANGPLWYLGSEARWEAEEASGGELLTYRGPGGKLPKLLHGVRGQRFNPEVDDDLVLDKVDMLVSRLKHTLLLEMGHENMVSGENMKRAIFFETFAGLTGFTDRCSKALKSNFINNMSALEHMSFPKAFRDDDPIDQKKSQKVER